MKTSDYQYQLLLDQATALYNSEKKLTVIFEALKINTQDANLKQIITLEADENKRHCTRLEGLLEVLDRTPFKNVNRDEAAKQNFVQQCSTMLKRITFKHATFGYKTVTFAALA